MKIVEIKDPVKRLFAFAKERYSIYLQRQDGHDPPWTKDEILRDYRFCNVYREDDKVTRWIRENWREPNTEDPDLWFAMCVARMFNEPSTLELIGYPVPFGKLRNQRMAKLIHRHEVEGVKVFNGAYIIATGGLSVKKVAYVWSNLDDLWTQRIRLRPTKDDTLNSYHMLLGQMQGFGSFMTAQVIADIKYHPPLDKASDWWTFAASGPGSRRGLNYVLGRERGEHWNEEEWRLELGRLREKLLPLFKNANMPTPHAQDVQNLLCEWSKYYRAATEGKMPKQLYRWNMIQEEDHDRTEGA
jgi:5-hmdU DNA kinase, helical domain